MRVSADGTAGAEPRASASLPQPQLASASAHAGVSASESGETAPSPRLCARAHSPLALPRLARAAALGWE
eukprot:588933-Rhodomonas_salina.1